MTQLLHATKLSLQTLGRHVLALDGEAIMLDAQLARLVFATAPELLGLYGVGIGAAILLATAGDNPERIRSESHGHTCAASPRCRRRQARSPAGGSTRAATARRTKPCGASCSPACARSPRPVPTSRAGSRSGAASPRSCASSN